MYINLSDYFGPFVGHPDATDEVVDRAEELLAKVNGLMEVAFEEGIEFHINPATNSYISGKTLGGFRPKDSTVGSKNSSHKQGRGIDIYDPFNEFDEWLYIHQAALITFDLYMEHPSATPKWTHLTDRAPGSLKRVFLP